MAFALFVVLAFFPPAARAQPAGAATPAVRFTVFSAKPLTGLAFVSRPGAAAQPVQFFPTARSPRYEYRGPTPLKFVDANSGEVVAEATLPPGVLTPLLLFSPLASEATGASSTLRYQIAVLDDGTARQGPGGLAILNLSGLALTGTVNRETVTLQSGLNPTLKVGAAAKIALQTQFKGRTYQSYAATAALKPAERALLILFPPFYKGSLEVQSRLLVDQPPGAGGPATKR